MNQLHVWIATAVITALSGCAGTATQPLAPNRDPIVTVDQFVAHISTVPAIAGQKVGIFVRQKAALSHLPLQGRADMAGRVVLFVHGATVPSVPDYDLDFPDYNWMTFLAQAGFNVYAMDVSGYGSSPRPMMDDPCNVNPRQQAVLKGRPLQETCTPHHPYDFNTIRSDWDDIDAVVNYVRAVNHVERIHLIGWSAGGPRVGGYVAQHPEKIDRVMLYAPSPTIAGPVPDAPGPGFPVTLQTREDLEKNRWDPDVRCKAQVELGVRDAVWKAIMQWDRIGAAWGPKEGVMRGRTATSFGWTRDLAGKVTAPTLVMVGEYDRLKERHTVYDEIASAEKVFVTVACASHFMVWEKQHRALQNASLEWLRDRRLQGITRGELQVDADGKFWKSN